MNAQSLYQITVTTPRLVLRIPKEHKEFTELGQILANGIQKGDQPHFMDESLYGKSAEEHAKDQQIFVEKSVHEWNNNNWHIPFAIFYDSKAIGLITMFAHDFPIAKGFGCSYWIGLPYQGKGLGTESFQAVLSFGFDRLDAQEAYAGAWSDNIASLRLMEKLGFVFNGEYWMARNGQAIKDKRMRLPKEQWKNPENSSIEGLQGSEELFS